MSYLKSGDGKSISMSPNDLLVINEFHLSAETPSHVVQSEPTPLAELHDRVKS